MKASIKNPKGLTIDVKSSEDLNDDSSMPIAPLISTWLKAFSASDTSDSSDNVSRYFNRLI